MKVLHVITGLAAGGAERQLLDLVSHHTLRSEVAVLTNPGVMAGAIRDSGVPVHHLGMTGNRDLRVLPRLARLMRAGRYDVVHTHLYRAGLYGRLAARMAGVTAIVATEHSIGEERIEGRRITWPVRMLARGGERLGHATIAVSMATARRLLAWGVPRSRIEVIPNGIDSRVYAFDPTLRKVTRSRLEIRPGTVVVGGVGRLDHGKRFDVAIRAVADVPDVVLLLVGDGPARLDLLALARRLNVAHRVLFAGESAQVPALLSAMDLFVAPSPEETFGLAVVEALAAGLPVLYNACPALEELPPGAAPGARRVACDPDAIGDAIRALIAGGLTRHPCPAAVAHYDIRHHVARVEGLYQRILEQAAKAGTAGPTLEEYQ
ncbi:glycosyltransferase [Thermoactinospora rubra]|uniref:glycosyltransferase n=1 Tax=Thermoactinospora rubra TaxID=1088767 RepID=UPI000A122740|nr:glycosyltransferase [Thermoactinospora rubra]